jgi:hypothetical protein
MIDAKRYTSGRIVPLIFPLRSRALSFAASNARVSKTWSRCRSFFFFAMICLVVSRIMTARS